MDLLSPLEPSDKGGAARVVKAQAPRAPDRVGSDRRPRREDVERPRPPERELIPVASFSCPCGAREEVREPAPEAIDCWDCKRPLSSRRWEPGYAPPGKNARAATEAERLRIGQPAPATAGPAPKGKAPRKRVESAWKPNPGRCPDDAKGRRVEVKLANGEIGHGDPNPMSPPGWAADGPHGLRWAKRGFPLDVEFYRVIK